MTKNISQFASYLDLFEKIADPVVLLDSDKFCMLDINSATITLLGDQKQKLLGQSFLDWVHEIDRDKCLEILNESKTSDTIIQHRCFWSPPAANLCIMDINVACLNLSNGEKVIQVIAKDVTNVLYQQKKSAKYLLELQSANQRLEQQSTIDEMTGIANFRHFKKAIEIEHSRAQRTKSKYSVIFFDVDHFKNYNDKNGHPMGDALLRSLAELFKKSCRDIDLTARYGGEEFVILCPETDVDQALVVAERVRNNVEKALFPNAETQPLGKVTVSMGVASYPDNGDTFEKVIEVADQGVYCSKNEGRNRITSPPKKAKGASAA